MSLLKLTTHERRRELLKSTTRHSWHCFDSSCNANYLNSWSIMNQIKIKIKTRCAPKELLYTDLARKMSLEKPHIFGTKPNIWDVKYVCRDQMPLLKAPKHTIGNRWKVSHLSVSTCEWIIQIYKPKDRLIASKLSADDNISSYHYKFIIMAPQLGFI